MARPVLQLEDYVAGVTAGDRSVLARAITLMESTRPADKRTAQSLLQALLPRTGGALRLGITGVPGVGKSTLIDQLGSNLTAAGHKLAVLAIDPSSSRTGGSILGDKTRMARLAGDRNAFIRPSPSGGTLGGVARRTREIMALCEAAGFDVVIVETVGVGQSETAVSEMVDFFLVLALPGAGDELQGIKKGVLELADMIAVNKADGDNLARARLAKAEYEAALNILTPAASGWRPPVILVSGLTNVGLDLLWAKIEEFRALSQRSSTWSERRKSQQVRWMHALLDEHIRTVLLGAPHVAARLSALEIEVRAGRLTPQLAVAELAGLMGLAAV